MKNRKKYLALALAAALCLTLAACGSESGNNGSSYDSSSGSTGEADTPPESFEGMVKDDRLLVDYGMYCGTWIGEDDSELIVEKDQDGDEVRFDLYKTAGDITASGYIQLVMEYSADYFYNEFDGWAHHSWLDEGGALHVDSLGTFTKVSGDLPGENIGDGDFTALTGTWYLDGEAGAPSVLEIDQYGSWTLYERAGGDGDMNEVDSGTLSADPDAADTYYASSALFDDVVYDMTLADVDVLYWGGEYDCYQRVG